MTGSADLSAAGHFGRQLKKSRQARGWTVLELAARTGIDAAHLGRIENGRRPPTERVALACDTAFPERAGWFSDWYRESREWSEVPPAFRDFGEYEDSTTSLLVWMPSVLDGLLQTEAYARALLSTWPGASEEQLSQRLANRLGRQRRLLYRDEPPQVLFLVDELCLYRRVGSVGTMAEQMAHVLTVAALPHVTLQLVPPAEHPATASGFVIAGDAAYAEHVSGGYAYVGQRVAPFVRLVDSLRGECRRVSESIGIIQEMREIWGTGGNPLTVRPTAVSA
jgi:transcriptional regulator with XRE-family HTH domain